MPSIGGFSISVTANTAGLNKGFKKARGMTTAFASGITGAAAGVARIVAPIGFIAGMGKVITIGATFEKQMSAVSTFVRGADSNMAALTQTAKDLGASTTFSAVEAGQAMVELGKSGFDASQVMAAVPAVLSLAQAGSLSMGDAASIAGSTLKQFGLDASETTNVVDALAAAASSGNLTVADFASQMGHASGGAQGLGMDIDETAAALSFLADGVTAERMGRTFSAMSSSLTSVTPAAQAVLDELDVSFTDKDTGIFKSLPTIINEFNAAFAGMNPAEKERRLGAMFNENAIKGWRFALNRGGDALQDIMTQVADNEGFGLKQSENMVDNLAGSFEMLKSAATGAAIEIAETFNTDLRAALDATGAAITGLTAMWTDQGAATGAAMSLADSAFGLFVINLEEHFDWIFSNWSNLFKDMLNISTAVLSNIATNLVEAFRGGELVDLTEGFERTSSELRLTTADELRNELRLMGDEAAAASDDVKAAADGAAARAAAAGDGAAARAAARSMPHGAIVGGAIAMKGSEEAFDVINRAIKGEQGYDKTIAKEAEKQTKLLQDQVSLLENISGTGSSEVFSFA